MCNCVLYLSTQIIVITKLTLLYVYTVNHRNVRTPLITIEISKFFPIMMYVEIVQFN